jgi:hypothetical protein
MYARSVTSWEGRGPLRAGAVAQRGARRQPVVMQHGLSVSWQSVVGRLGGCSSPLTPAVTDMDVTARHWT